MVLFVNGYLFSNIMYNICRHTHINHKVLLLLKPWTRIEILWNSQTRVVFSAYLWHTWFMWNRMRFTYCGPLNWIQLCTTISQWIKTYKNKVFHGVQRQITDSIKSHRRQVEINVQLGRTIWHHKQHDQGQVVICLIIIARSAKHCGVDGHVEDVRLVSD